MRRIPLTAVEAQARAEAHHIPVTVEWLFLLQAAFNAALAELHEAQQQNRRLAERIKVLEGR